VCKDICRRAKCARLSRLTRRLPKIAGEKCKGGLPQSLAVATGSTNENTESNPSGPSGLQGQVKWKAPNGYDIVVLKTEEQRSKATNYYKQMIFPNTQFRAMYMGEIEYKGEACYARKCDCSGPSAAHAVAQCSTAPRSNMRTNYSRRKIRNGKPDSGFISHP
jgi:hypothetical protein